ncbi:hypothetical protein J6590_069773 [Homalodisca vitripennis]|nr:hypothetical protein J6590_069773 [Homalodisca vitripennis]
MAWGAPRGAINIQRLSSRQSSGNIGNLQVRWQSLRCGRRANNKTPGDTAQCAAITSPVNTN